MGIYFPMTKWGDFLKNGGIFCNFSGSISFFFEDRAFSTYNSYSLAFQNTCSWQPLTSFLGCSIARASVHVTGLRWVLITGVRGSE